MEARHPRDSQLLPTRVRSASVPSTCSDLSVGATWVAPTTCSHLQASRRNLGVWAAEKDQHMGFF